MLVTTTIGIPPDLFIKTVKYGINRSQVSRDALIKECERIEREEGNQTL